MALGGGLGLRGLFLQGFSFQEFRVYGFEVSGFRGFRAMSMKTVVDRRAFNWSDMWHHQFDFASIFFVFQ